jgi:methylmalonyl-CoA mutase
MAPSDPTFTELPAFEELFEQPSLDDWRQAAEASLKGRPLDRLTVRTHEGLAIPPLFTAKDIEPQPGWPGSPPFVRGRTALGPGADGWEVCPCIDHPDPGTAARWAAEELGRGATSIWLVCDPATRLIDDDVAAPAGPGVHLSDSSDLEALCRSVDLAVTPIHLDAGANTVAVASALIAAARRCGIDPHDLTGTLGCDPLGALVADGELGVGIDGSLTLLAELVSWSELHAPGLVPIVVSTLPYHLAGATAVHELAYGLATGVEILRALADRGIEAERACRRIAFRHAVGRDLFMEAAKLRAGRRLWARVAEACGVGPELRAAPVHAVASPRGLSRRDPWVNMLRTTAGAFAAAVGGADTITVLPFDHAVGIPDGRARRMATNSQTILREESHVGQVVDPGAGAWYLEWLTGELAEVAWQLFQRIEAEGGMRSAITSGAVADDLHTLRGTRDRALATVADPVTGVSSFPKLGERPLQRTAYGTRTTGNSPAQDAAGELARLLGAAASPAGDGAVIEAAVSAAAAGAGIARIAAALRGTRERTTVARLPVRREAELFEHLRDASDAFLGSTGARPLIFLANMGPVPEHKARATFAANFAESGGIEAVTNDGFASVEAAVDAFASSGAAMAVICSSDARYAEVVPELAKALTSRGARTVLVAGRPGEYEAAWREAGVTGFIHLGCDRIRILEDLLREEGVLHV